MCRGCAEIVPRVRRDCAEGAPRVRRDGAEAELAPESLGARLLRQADDFARYCASSYALNCMNHTTGSAAMVEPLVRFLLAAL